MMKDLQGSDPQPVSPDSDQTPQYYEIKVQEYLDDLWVDWFEGMRFSHIENSEGCRPCTLISCMVPDQSALHGLLMKIRDLNLTLISVHKRDPFQKMSIVLPTHGKKSKNMIRR